MFFVQKYWIASDGLKAYNDFIPNYVKGNENPFYALI